MNQSPTPIAPATRTLKTWAAVARWMLWLVLAAWGLFALSWATLHLLIVPRIDDWRPALERSVSASLGVSVRVGAIRADSGRDAHRWLPAFLPGLVPALELSDVRLLDASGRQALHLPRVRVALSVGSLWRLGFEQVVLERPVLDVRRTAQGRIEVAGLDLSGPGHDGGRALDWLLSQTEFVIQGGTVRWSDELRAQPPLRLDALDLVLRNTVRTHQIRLDATPPPEWGERLSLRARLREPLWYLGRVGRAAQARWERWDGDLYADFSHLDLVHLRAYADLSPWGVELSSGRGALRVWVDVTRGRIAGVTSDFALQAVQARLGPQLPALLLDELAGRIDSGWSAAGWSLRAENLHFRTRDGLVWPRGRLQLQHSAGGRDHPASTQLTVERLDLATLAAIAPRLPLPRNGLDRLATLRPSGEIQGLSASWQAAAAAQPGAARQTPAADSARGSYWAKGRVVGLTLAGQASGRQSSHGDYPLPGRPGIEGATVDFDLNQGAGQARLSIQNGALDLPGVFEDSRVPVQSLRADVAWRVQGEHIEVQVDRLHLVNADAEGTAQLRWHTGDAARSASGSRFPGVLDLRASLTRADATRVHRYLPLSVPPYVRHYVREAVRAGRASRVDLRMQGEIYQMPFAAPDAQGEFRIGAQLQGVDLSYVPPYLQAPDALPWPGLRGVAGELLLERNSLRFTGTQAELVGAPQVRLSQVDLTLDDLADNPVLVLNMRAQGPAAQMLHFVQNSPLNDLTAQALARTRIGGPAQLQLRLQLPLYDSAAVGVAGTLRLDGNDVLISPEAPLLGRASARVQFSERDFQVIAARAYLYGGEVRFEGGMNAAAAAPARIHFRGQGTASAEGLSDAGLGFVSRLFGNASGSSAYSVELGFRGGVPELLVSSTLQGMAINLPAPLYKTAAATLPLRFERTVLSLLDESARTDRLLLQLGTQLAPLVHLQYERDIGAAEPRVLRGSVAVGLDGGAQAPLPAYGVFANIQLSQIHVDAWERVFAATTGVDVRSALPQVPRAAAQHASLGYLPTTLAMRADRLTLAGRHFHRLVLGGSREGTLWRASIDADELSGYLEFRPPSAASAGSVLARLARLNLPPTAAREVEQLLQQPTSMPALDIAVDELKLASRHLGRLEVQAVNRLGAARTSEWHLSRLRLSLPEARLDASGHWVAHGQRRTALDVRLDIEDSGLLLARFGHHGAVRGGKGRIEGHIGWHGSPLALDYASLSGQLQAEIERGQFLKIEPGVAKLLGVFSLQALPRRLALDFRDVFSDGFSFDFVRGDARIEHGVLYTNNLQMKGVNAAVLMEGRVDLAREQQDLKVVVVPEINAGTASLIATVINPGVGLGTFLAQFLLRQPLQSAATQEFRITGNWIDPEVERIERGVAARPAPDPPSH